eukprot:TRINITY_DN27287_c0_g1_i1.p1 TRINITY_DN27287_c0_g1~~TRINITY_DN27287_c0_g1_i1.p1  ORF type:complete len:442 (+),score=87.90 TRINITY_DN27287_c0_g1_i1:102-1427(+)
MLRSLVGSEMCIRDRVSTQSTGAASGAEMAGMVVVCLLLCSIAMADHYQTLGVTRAATLTQIKRAYRAKARESHPDKNPTKDPAQAAADFRRIVDAYETLSDQQARREYDHGGQARSWSTSEFFNKFWGNHRRAQHHRSPYMYGRGYLNRFLNQIREAQARCLNLRSMSHLAAVAIDDSTGRADRHVLVAIFGPDLSSVVDWTVAYPYPFAGLSANQIWWEDMMLTAKLQMNSRGDCSVCRQLRVDAQAALQDPVFVMVKKGDKLGKAVSISTRRHEDFQAWVWENLRVQVRFVNHHHHPVNLWWIHGSRGKLKGEVAVNGFFRHNVHLSHEFWAIDSRVTDIRDSNKLSASTVVGVWKATSPGVYQVRIQARDCLDLDHMCSFWARHPPDECDRNPQFMQHRCPWSCRVCNSTWTDNAWLPEMREGEPNRRASPGNRADL